MLPEVHLLLCLLNPLFPYFLEVYWVPPVLWACEQIDQTPVLVGLCHNLEQKIKKINREMNKMICEVV